ncbi:hypothetical protein CF68_22525 [Cupriavidus sp. SK-4]|uniref:hypothetical protein n=1 Tax=Cupriavidus sp. SK-4 TaxID=574750 RepID=UPI000448A435|nr:hypothetical protein [Cupriavidus sp. SK-4]EYS96039.1 hypothetical protein CF68_22525 [Cupriavidus sp. SK-4]
MSKSEPFLGTTTERDKAFPDIKEMRVVVTQDPWQSYRRTPAAPTSTYTKTSLPRFERCLNPRCQQGGLDLQSVVLFWEDGEHEFFCKGHEGSPAGRRVGDPCDNVFTVTLTTVR